MCTSAVFLAGKEVSTGYRLRLYSILLMLRIPIYLKSWRKKILRSEAHDSVVYGWPRSLPEVRTVFQIHPIPCSRSFSPGPLDKQAPISTHKFSRLTSLNSGCIWLNNCVAECRRVPGMSRGFHFWQRQTDRQTDRLTDRQSYGFMAGKPAPSSYESQANGTRHLSHWLKEEGWGKSPIWCIQDGPRFRHYTNCWHRQRDGAPCCSLP